MMARLLLVELRRSLSRGVTRVMTPLGAVLIVAVGVLAFIFMKQPDQIRAEARERYNQRVERCVHSMPPTASPGAEASPGATPSPPPDLRARCEQGLKSQLEYEENIHFELEALWPDVVAEIPEDSRDQNFLEFSFIMQGLITMPSLMLIMGAVVGGASMVGAEWQAGTFATLLTWEPRRGRLLAARIAASAIVGFGIGVALLALFSAALVPTAMVHDGMPETRHWWFTLGITILKYSGLTALAAAVGTALGMIGKRTVFAMIALVGYLIGCELILRQYWEESRPWLLMRNMAIALGADQWYTNTATWKGAGILLGFSALIILAAYVLFARRDFTSTG
jgi:ABC-type transport system involved in multi-copper enzyme maturation permease subunit